MRNLGSKISRIIITGVLIILQIIWTIIFLLKITACSSMVGIVLKIMSIIFVIYLMGKDDNSTYRMGWIFLIMLWPVVGVLGYLFFGGKKPTKKMKKRTDSVRQDIMTYLVQNDTVAEKFRSENKRCWQTGEYIYKYSFYPYHHNSKAKYYECGEKMFDDMLKAIERAEKYIFLEYFIIDEGIMWSEILERLVMKAEEGVKIRIIYDDMGCVALLPWDYKKYLEGLHDNIECMVFNQIRPFLDMVMNHRDHKKILVVDGKVGFTGGINIADEYINKKEKYGYWKDTGIKIEGDAVVNFVMMFLENWRSNVVDSVDVRFFLPEKGEKDKLHEVQHAEREPGEKKYEEKKCEENAFVQPFVHTPFGKEAVAEQVYIDLLNQARDYVYIYTPYLIIANEMRSALCLAAKRGVDVKIVVPGVPDKKLVYRLTRANYKTLLNVGVKIYEYAPGFLHGKSYVCDDKVAVLGTINMDFRSLYLQFECGVFLYGSEVIYDMRRDCEETLKKSYEITLTNRKNNIFDKLLVGILRVFSPLM